MGARRYQGAAARVGVLLAQRRVTLAITNAAIQEAEDDPRAAANGSSSEAPGSPAVTETWSAANCGSDSVASSPASPYYYS